MFTGRHSLYKRTKNVFFLLEIQKLKKTRLLGTVESSLIKGSAQRLLDDRPLPLSRRGLLILQRNIAVKGGSDRFIHIPYRVLYDHKT